MEQTLWPNYKAKLGEQALQDPGLRADGPEVGTRISAKPMHLGWEG